MSVVRLIAIRETELSLDEVHAAAGRRIARKEATITAAGATVAVIGTAAIIRRARRHRRTDP